MKRLIEWGVGLAILAGMASASVCSSKQFNGSWGAEPTPEVLQVWQQYKASVETSTPWSVPTTRELVRASAPRAIFDSRLKKNVQAVKVEYLEHSPPESNLKPRRATIVVGYDDGKLLRVFLEGKGPQEYRGAF